MLLVMKRFGPLALLPLIAACSYSSVTVPASQGALNMYENKTAVQTAPHTGMRYVPSAEAEAAPNLGPTGANLLVPSQQQKAF